MRKPLQMSEFDDRDDSTWRCDTYRELEWIRHEKGWAPGWTKWTFKELFGSWPEDWMEDLTPMPASEALQKWVRAKISAFVREKKKSELGGAVGTVQSSARETECNPRSSESDD